MVATLALLVAVLGVPLGEPAGGGRVQVESATDADPTATVPTGVLPPGGRWTVTLLTGEVVDVRSDDEGRVTAAVREHQGSFRTVRHPDGRIYVIPVAVTPLVDRVLDLELFNVTGLVRQGYDDASSDVVPLIVQSEPGTDVQTTLNSEGEQPLASIDAVAVEVPKARTEVTGEEIRSQSTAPDAGEEGLDGITRVSLDRRITTTAAPPAASTTLAAPASGTDLGQPSAPELDPNLTQIGADEAWAAGLTGEGATVGVLDTGIDAQHPDVAGKVVAEENFSDSPDTVDRYGHGTHVAAIAAGTGTAADGARQGVAPDADLVVGKVLDDEGFGFESDVIAGMEWAAPQAEVVNMSLGGPPSDGSDPLAMSLDRLAEEHGTLFVVAAGNSGPLSQSVESPGVADQALTVGAVNVQDDLAEFSSRGPLPSSFALKPEVVAPGVDIVSARAADTAMGEPVDDNYTSASGTSMATPHVAGAAAVLAQQHPDWSAGQLKSTLIGSADDIDADGYDVGGGRIDIGEGIATALQADTDVVEVPLPQPRTEPHDETLSWTNTGEDPLTVALDAELEDRQGAAADEVSVEPAEVTIAPGASASATVRVDGPDLEDGLYSGTVTASTAAPRADESSVRTPIAVHAEPEMVDLTIEATFPQGTGAMDHATFAAVVNLDDFAAFNQFVIFEGDSLTLPVPVGRYAVIGDVSSTNLEVDANDFDTAVVAQVGDPEVDITQDTTVALDGAAAVPFHPTVEGVDTAPPMYSNVNLSVTPSAGTDGFALWTSVFALYPEPPVRVTPMEADSEHFSVIDVFRLQAPHLAARVGDETIEVTEASFEVQRPQFAPGDHTVSAVYAGDGSDLSTAQDRLAVVQLPADRAERRAIIGRSAEAGVAVLAFVDEQRSHLSLTAGEGVPLIAAGGTSASRLRAAGEAGEDVTITSAASPYVYDIVLADTNEVDPAPVIDRAAQRRLATLDERFHRDPNGTGSFRDRRWPSSIALMNLDSEGPLPERRTAYVTPNVTWRSVVVGRVDGIGRTNPDAADAGRIYDAGSRQTVTWLRRPQWPGPVGSPPSEAACQPLPVRRSADTLQVWLAPFQDGLDRFSCAEPIEARLTLEHDGTAVGVDSYFAEFPVPAEEATYRLSYQQDGESPYPHRSSTTWTFASAAPAGAGREPIPLLVVDYQLPLDTRNRPIGDTATLSVDHVTGSDADHAVVLRPQVWTSTDDGTSWQPAPVRRKGRGAYEVTLPEVEPGTGVSLRVDARDTDGNQIEQALLDAYTG